MQMLLKYHKLYTLVFFLIKYVCLIHTLEYFNFFLIVRKYITYLQNIDYNKIEISTTNLFIFSPL